MSWEEGPLLVFGPGSEAYDFGPDHPLTPRRFGPGIDLLRSVGAHLGLAPEPASDAELRLVHEDRYLRVVRRFSEVPSGRPEAGIGPGDVPPFAGMHGAAATVAGGSLRAVDAILRGEVLHAFHPGGGLHHAMPARASGFCIYNDVALAIARARAVGQRVLYVDLDVHHGDGVEAIHRNDPGVLTFSIHETGHSLFPGTGFVEDGHDGPAAGTIVNLPLEPGTGAGPWLAAVERLVPELAAAFGPDLVVSQHGSDAHAWDPLAHLRLTTTAMAAAARLVDAEAHRHAAGRWLATGGGGYDVYRVVPRAWSLVWLAGAHREPPAITPPAWRARWADVAARHGQAPLPERFEDDPDIGLTIDGSTGGDRRAAETADLVRRLAVPALIRHAVDAGWWSPGDPRSAGDSADAAEPTSGGRQSGAGDAPLSTKRAPVPDPAIVAALDAATWSGLRLAGRVAGPADPRAGHRLLLEALRFAGGDVVVTAAIESGTVVGLAVSAQDGGAGDTSRQAADAAAQAPAARRLLALGVAPPWRGAGLGRAVLAAHLGEVDRRREPGGIEMLITAAERDVFEPVARADRVRMARRLLEGAGFRLDRAPGAIGRADPHALLARRFGTA